jgi:two-component system KDP operon response regulator KdpE
MSVRPRVLVCDAESQSLRGLRVVLRGAGFEVDETSTGKAALDRAALHAPSAAIVELVLPDGDGVEVCRRLREWSAMPLIVLSAINEEDQNVRALEAGADHYLTKPFGARELIARLNATLRRADRGDDQPHLALHGLEIDLAARVVHREGKEVHLTPIEFRLLRVMVHQRGRLLTHGALLRQVWGTAYEQDRPTLRTHVANLRRKLEPAEGLPLIDTQHGVGYRFTDSHPEKATRARPATPRTQSLALLIRDDSLQPRRDSRAGPTHRRASDTTDRRAA